MGVSNMKSLKDFTKYERVVTLCSSVWIVLIFVIAFTEATYYRGFYFDDFVLIFCVFGVIPVLLLVGGSWIYGAKNK